MAGDGKVGRTEAGAGGAPDGVAAGTVSEAAGVELVFAVGAWTDR